MEVAIWTSCYKNDMNLRPRYMVIARNIKITKRNGSERKNSRKNAKKTEERHRDYRCIGREEIISLSFFFLCDEWLNWSEKAVCVQWLKKKV